MASTHGSLQSTDVRDQGRPQPRESTGGARPSTREATMAEDGRCSPLWRFAWSSYLLAIREQPPKRSYDKGDRQGLWRRSRRRDGGGHLSLGLPTSFGEVLEAEGGGVRAGVPCPLHKRERAGDDAVAAIHAESYPWMNRRQVPAGRITIRRRLPPPLDSSAASSTHRRFAGSPISRLTRSRPVTWCANLSTAGVSQFLAGLILPTWDHVPQGEGCARSDVAYELPVRVH